MGPFCRNLMASGKRSFGLDTSPIVTKWTLTIRSLEHLKHALKWQGEPKLDYAHLDAFDSWIDINGRRRNDAAVVALACAQADCRTVVEIGTGQGHMTAVMAEHAPGAVVHTVNIPPEDISVGGKLTTYAPTREQIGEFYRSRGCNNVQQILANTRDWVPCLSSVDVVFIDGCHDAEYVYADTKKMLQTCHPGSVILWHDFAPDLRRKYDWIEQVCLGVEWLMRDRLIQAPLLHLQDSWIGIYRVPSNV